MKNFLGLHERDKVLVMGDMNEHIELFGERTNENGSLIREACQELRLEF